MKMKAARRSIGRILLLCLISPLPLTWAEAAASSPGRLMVAPGVMHGRLLTQVSPSFPQSDTVATGTVSVVVRSVISKTGLVTPLHIVSGQSSLEASAMSALRLWRYRPYVRDGEAVEVTTDVSVDFSPGKPGGIVSHPNH